MNEKITHRKSPATYASTLFKEGKLNISTMNDLCPICSNNIFIQESILWHELIQEWSLTEEETRYINRQQGFQCIKCQNNLRVMGLAYTILKEINFKDNFQQFCESKSAIQILQINTIGNLDQYLQALPNRKIVTYPEYDMQHLQLSSDSYDLITHSDTLEHIPNPEIALTECHRVLRDGGRCIFTIPIIVDRLTRSRQKSIASYHGTPDSISEDLLVHTEFGADMWKTVLKAGFSSCEIVSYEYPACLVIVAKK